MVTVDYLTDLELNMLDITRTEAEHNEQFHLELDEVDLYDDLWYDYAADLYE